MIGASLGAGLAQATTGLGYEFVIGVRLLKTGVAFTRQQHVPRGSTVQFVIKNLSPQPRWFVIGGRKTRLLQPNQKETYYLGFEIRGKFTYRSWGPNAKMYRGTFVVS
jgi:hypothetical protein